MTHARAKQLVRAIYAAERRAATLRDLITAARMVGNGDDYQRIDATNYEHAPERLAGIAALYQRTDAETRRMIDVRYRYLLANILEAPGTGLKPVKLDFDALPSSARCAVLTPYLKLVVGHAFPHLDLAHSNPERGILVYVHTGGPVPLAEWTQHLPAISAYLGGTYQITKSTSTTITLAQHTPLPEVIPFDVRYLKHDQVFYGFDVVTRAPVYVPLTAMTHTLTAGQSGSGKSVFLNQILLSLLFNIDRLDGLTLVDLKGGVELGFYAGVHPKIHVITDYDALPDVAAELVATMQDRLAQLRASGQRAATSNFHFLVIDEYAAIQFQTFAKKEAKDSHKKLLADLNLLAAQARAPGIKLWAQLQKPTADAMDTSFRTNLQSIAAFKIPNINASVIFDGLKDMPVKPSDLRKGQCVLSLDGQPDRVVQSCLVPDTIDLARIVALGRTSR